MTDQKKRLILFLTMKCNIECSHCAVSSSPRRQELMSLQDAESYITQAYELGFDALTFTGGECFLYPELLFPLIKLGSTYTMRVSCVTNCFWGKTQSQAQETVLKLKDHGLAFIDISADTFHEEFIPYSNLENVLTACSQNHLPVIVKVAGTFGKFFTDKIQQTMNQYTLNHDIIQIQEITCMPMGAAKDNIPPDHFFRINTEFLTDSLCPVTEDFVIMPSGNAYPCCSPGGFTEPLQIGNVKTLGLRAALYNYPPPELSVMELYGPINVAKAVIALGGTYTLKTDYTSFCETCHDLLGDPLTANLCREISSIPREAFKELVKNGNTMIEAQKIMPQTLEEMYEELKKIPQDPMVAELFKINDEINLLEKGLLPLQQQIVQNVSQQHSTGSVQNSSQKVIEDIAHSKNNNFL